MLSGVPLSSLKFLYKITVLLSLWNTGGSVWLGVDIILMFNIFKACQDLHQAFSLNVLCHSNTAPYQPAWKPHNGLWHFILFPQWISGMTWSSTLSTTTSNSWSHWRGRWVHYDITPDTDPRSNLSSAHSSSSEQGMETLTGPSSATTTHVSTVGLPIRGIVLGIWCLNLYLPRLGLLSDKALSLVVQMFSKGNGCYAKQRKSVTLKSIGSFHYISLSVTARQTSGVWVGCRVNDLFSAAVKYTSQHNSISTHHNNKSAIHTLECRGVINTIVFIPFFIYSGSFFSRI